MKCKSMANAACVATALPVGHGLWVARNPESYVKLFADLMFFRTFVNTLVFFDCGDQPENAGAFQKPTGAETELLLQVDSEKIIVVIHGRTEARAGNLVGLQISAGKSHLFDSQSGARLQ